MALFGLTLGEGHVYSIAGAHRRRKCNMAYFLPKFGQKLRIAPVFVEFSQFREPYVIYGGKNRV